VLYAPPGESDETKSRVASHQTFLASKSPYLEYHYELMRLLGALCAGKTGITEIRVQAMYSPEHISLIIQNESACLTQRKVFSELFWHVFLDAQARALQLQSVLRSSNLISFYAHEMETLAKRECLSNNEQAYLLTVILPCIGDILKNVDEQSSSHGELRSAVAQYAEDLAAKLDGCLSESELEHFAERVDAICPASKGKLATMIFPLEEPSERRMEPDDGTSRNSMIYARFIQALRTTPEIQAAIDEDHQRLVSCILDVESTTDPDDGEYRRRLDLDDSSEACRRAKADKRKTKVLFYEAFVRRIVRYMETRSEDASPATFVDCLMILSSIVERPIASYQMVDVLLVGDQALETARIKMVEAQDNMSASGAAALCVHLLSSKRDAIACCAMKLAINMLEGGNVKVQQSMYEELVRTPQAIKAIESRLQRAQAR